MPDRNLQANELIREIDADTWTIGDKILLSHGSTSDANKPSWSDGQGSFYFLSEAPNLVQLSRPLLPTSAIKKVHDAGGIAAAWKVGDAFLKVRDLDRFELQATREHVTLAKLRDKGGLSFAIPEVFYHALWGNRYIVVLKAVPGQTLGEEWPNMHEELKQHYVDRVVGICKELETWENYCIGGVDGYHLADNYLMKRGARLPYTHENLVANCKDMGMDCSIFRFYHCDLGPGNIIVNVADRTIGIIDWETAGFVPREWIRTKFRISSGLDLPGPSNDENRLEWRRRVQKKLEEVGFHDVVDKWMSWWDKR